MFNTVLSGYQEVITDPSYAGQIITFTTPHIGNYGTNAADFESRGTFCRGIVVRELARRHSNHRADSGLEAMLRLHGVPGIAGIDTRRLTRILRDTGAMPAAFGSVPEADLAAAAAAEPGTDGIDLVSQVTIDAGYTVGRARSRQRHTDRRRRLRHEAQHRRQPLAASAPSRWCLRPRAPPTSSLAVPTACS